MAETREPHRDAQDGQPTAEVVRETVDPSADRTTQREAVELELQERDRSEDGEEIEVDEIVEDIDEGDDASAPG